MSTDINWIVLSRPGYDVGIANPLHDRVVATYEELKASKGGAIWVFEGSDFQISSTELRRCLQAVPHINQEQQALLDSYLAPQVQEYIHTHSLYRL